MPTELNPLPKRTRPEMNMVIWPDERLAEAVHPFPEENIGSRLVRDTAGGMIRAMYKHMGVGLAAQQVGIPFQIFIIDAFWTQEGAKKKPKVFLNPKITGHGNLVVSLPKPGEGCLSFPYDHHAVIERYNQVELEWLDFKGEVHHQWFDGVEAIVVQHEFDHLMGCCYIDHLSKLRRDAAIRKARKMRRHYRNGMRMGIKHMKSLRSSGQALVVRNREFEKNRRNKLMLEDAADLALCEARLKNSEGTISLNEMEARVFGKAMENPPTANDKLEEATQRYKEAIEDGTLEICGDGEVADPRPSSRFSEASRRLVQREDARRDRQRVQLPVSDQDQEGDERTESSGADE